MKISKDNLLKTIILAENALLLLLSLVSTVLFMANISVGASLFLYSTYALYPIIFITFFVALFLKTVKAKEYKLNFILFGANLATSTVCLIAVLYKLAGALGSF